MCPFIMKNVYHIIALMYFIYVLLVQRRLIVTSLQWWALCSFVLQRRMEIACVARALK